jgi:hypothetical protein
MKEVGDLRHALGVPLFKSIKHIFIVKMSDNILFSRGSARRCLELKNITKTRSPSPSVSPPPMNKETSNNNGIDRVEETPPPPPPSQNVWTASNPKSMSTTVIQCPPPGAPVKKKRKKAYDLHSIVSVPNFNGIWMVSSTFLSMEKNERKARISHVVMANTTPYKDLFGHDDVLVMYNETMVVDACSLESIKPELEDRLTIRPFWYDYETQTLKKSQMLSEMFV